MLPSRHSSPDYLCNKRRSAPYDDLIGTPLRDLVGHRVELLLVNGTRVTATLVSAGTSRVSTLWLEKDGRDYIVPEAAVRGIRDLGAPEAGAPGLSAG